MIPKDAINRASLENLAAFKRASSFSNIPRPSSSSKKSKENENFIQFQQQQLQQSQQSQQQNLTSSQYALGGSTGNLHKQQVVVSSIPLQFNQNISNSQLSLTQRGKEMNLGQNNGMISSIAINSALSHSQQKLSSTAAASNNTANTTAPNSCQNTARNLSHNATILSSTSASKIHSSSNNVPNSARASSQKQVTQTTSSSINNLSVINLSNISQSQIPVSSSSQSNIRLSSGSTSNLQQATCVSSSSNLHINSVNTSNCQQNQLYPQSTTKNLREILQSSTTKQNNLHSHKLTNQTNKQGIDENSQSAVKQQTSQQQNVNPSSSSKRVLTTPSTIGNDDYNYKDLNFYKKEILRMSLTKQSSTLSQTSSSSNNGYGGVLNSMNVGNKENTHIYKQRHSDQIEMHSNSLLNSQSIASSSLLGDKPLTAAKKSKKNTNFYVKEIEYYRQREVEYLQKIQKLEKENKRVTQIVQKSDSDIQLLRNEIVAFSQRYNLSNSTQGSQQEDRSNSEQQQKQRVVTPAFTSQQQCSQDGQINVLNIHLQDLQNNNSDQPLHISDLGNNVENIDEAEYAKNQEKINLLQSYSANLEQKLKQLEYNIHSANYQQSTSTSKLSQGKDVINNCYKVLEQKYLSLYSKTKESKHESDDIQTQILFYLAELNKDPSNRANSMANEINLPNASSQLAQMSVLKALNIGKQLNQLTDDE